ncbi:hypothetical protein [Amycolatopsis sp. ATCC 39116]|uniref:hypothetical protein n=1 Tax=Amycolatopsis TaxID=1813 RepID=UPI0002628D4E|nr:hypothetical protein [Amycolatopsis sp. ATCC 39116]
MSVLPCRDFVFPHGATQSPAGWDRLTTILTAGGHRCATPDLPTGHPEWSTADYVRAIRRQVPAEFDAGLAVRHLA